MMYKNKKMIEEKDPVAQTTEENTTQETTEVSAENTTEIPEIDITKEHINNFEAHTIARSLIESPVMGQGFQNQEHFNYVQNLAFQTLDFARTLILIGGTNEEKVAKLDLTFEDLKKFNLNPMPNPTAQLDPAEITPSEEVK